MAKKKIKAADGIFGLGKGTVDTESEEFKILQQKILEASKNRTPEQRISDCLLKIRFQMKDYLNVENPNGSVIPVGESLRECVKALEIKNKDFASYIGIEESNLSAMFNGRRPISPDFALKLEQIFDIPATLWLSVQSKNELDLLRKSKSLLEPTLSKKELLARAT